MGGEGGQLHRHGPTPTRRRSTAVRPGPASAGLKASRCAGSSRSPRCTRRPRSARQSLASIGDWLGAFGFFETWRLLGQEEPVPRTLEQLVEAGMLLVGTPDDVGEQVQRLQDEFGLEYLVFIACAGAVEHRRRPDTIGLFGEHVIQPVPVAWGARGAGPDRRTRPAVGATGVRRARRAGRVGTASGARRRLARHLEASPATASRVLTMLGEGAYAARTPDRATRSASGPCRRPRTGCAGCATRRWARRSGLRTRPARSWWSASGWATGRSRCCGTSRGGGKASAPWCSACTRCGRPRVAGRCWAACRPPMAPVAAARARAPADRRDPARPGGDQQRHQGRAQGRPALRAAGGPQRTVVLLGRARTHGLRRTARPRGGLPRIRHVLRQEAFTTIVGPTALSAGK